MSHRVRMSKAKIGKSNVQLILRKLIFSFSKIALAACIYHPAHEIRVLHGLLALSAPNHCSAVRAVSARRWRAECKRTTSILPEMTSAARPKISFLIEYLVEKKLFIHRTTRQLCCFEVYFLYLVPVRSLKQVRCVLSLLSLAP